ncbi:MAG: DUF4931 domain-containing protein [Candidatus Woesearchaeota archaeon]|nr:MAG: DUF4931 domain-containing protein [Candidatus Woesearchaeota archaeon]
MELRKDYILDRWVVIASNRGKRAQQHKNNKHGRWVEFCAFCAGNEHVTPPEIYRIPDGDSWKIRVFANKFPAFDMNGDFKINTHNKYFTFSHAYGAHEIIVETSDHYKEFTDMSSEEINEVLRVYKLRIEELSKMEGIKYVLVVKNNGFEACESIIHSHSQVFAYNKIPSLIKEEVEANKGGCKYCNVVEIEKKSDRRCFENECFVAFTPYASRFNYEVWIFPKKHIKNLTEMNNSGLMYLADIIKSVLVKLKELGASYNFVLHQSPEGEDLHFHIEIMPRISTWAGFEFGSDDVINTVPPEDAAKFYRGEEA